MKNLNEFIRNRKKNEVIDCVHDNLKNRNKIKVYKTNKSDRVWTQEVFSDIENENVIDIRVYVDYMSNGERILVFKKTK